MTEDGPAATLADVWVTHGQPGPRLAHAPLSADKDGG